MTISQQQVINRLSIGDCSIEDGVLVPCGYHGNRAASSAVRFDATESKPREQGVTRIEPTEDARLVASLWPKHEKDVVPHPPAGGWFLVRTQRDWLRRGLVDTVVKQGRKELRVLVSGVASHVHYYTYLLILQEGADESGLKRIEVVVADQCRAPLDAIQEVARLGSKGLAEADRLRFTGLEILLHPTFVEALVPSGLLEDPRFHQSVVQADLREPSALSDIDPVDVVTEHFVSAVLKNMELLEEFRRTYARVLRPAGRLLCAVGVAPVAHPVEFESFLELNKRQGFHMVGLQASWDPYGMGPEEIAPLREGRAIEAQADNSLFVFERAEATGA